MSLSNKTREHIKQYILEQIYYKKPQIVSSIVETWNISRTTVNRYFKDMEKEGIIEKCNGNKYKLKEIKNSFFVYNPKKDVLEEDKIFEEDILPLIAEFPDNVKKIWNYAFCEIMNNAIEHSNAEKICVTVVCNALFTHIFISDDGIGIFEKIREYILKTSNMDITLDDAMSILFVGKMTTNKESHSGEGIFFSSRSLDRFYIFSSNRIFVHEAYDKNSSANINNMVDNEAKKVMLDESGTFVTMELWNNSKRQLREVFDMFSSDERGFYKTQIPIKSALPTGFPVSRSQARRLCSGFDKFEEIELDFDGVDDIGQAFAHEIFIVFQKKHPEINIKVKNTNENVLSMINRVRNTAL